MKSVFRIGSTELNGDEGIEFAIRYSKATSLARPISLKRVIKEKVEAMRPTKGLAGERSQVGEEGNGSTSTSTVEEGGALIGEGLEADVTPFIKYVVMRKKDKDKNMDVDVDGEVNELSDGENDNNNEEQEWVEEEVDKENLKKAYKFGSTWVPIDEDDFEKMVSTAGLDVLGFIKEDTVSSSHLLLSSFLFLLEPYLEDTAS